LWIGLAVFIITARRTGAITIKGKCPECGEEFELPPRTKALFKVKCPNGHEVLRIKAILEYIKSKRSGKE
jgi:phage FluMu protein Com